VVDSGVLVIAASTACSEGSGASLVNTMQAALSEGYGKAGAAATEEGY
jgi:hypothetical protein